MISTNLLLLFMIILNWNVRGASNNEFDRTLREIIRVNKPDILTLHEPRISGDRPQNVIRNLGFNHHILVEAKGFSGGIWILWNRPDISIIQISAHEQFLHVQVSDNFSSPWILTVVYASPRATEHAILWETILNISHSLNKDWMVLGD